MATLSELQDMWAADAKIDELDLGSSSTRTPLLHSKYVTHLSNFKLQERRPPTYTGSRESSQNTSVGNYLERNSTHLVGNRGEKTLFSNQI
jgi:hypothetical protein